MIKPTVGRKVWYRPSAGDISGVDVAAMAVIRGEPLDATIVAVLDDRCVNLAILDVHAKLHGRHSVPLVQEGDLAPVFGRFAEWMPYQATQAKKHEPKASSIPVPENGSLNFGQALDALKQGSRVARTGWIGGYLTLAAPQCDQGIAYFDVDLTTMNCKVGPWKPSCIDVLAEDWVILQ